jgi:hypothetical protein
LCCALLSASIFAHRRHGNWRQRETGSAFAANAMIKTKRLAVTGAFPDLVVTPSASGKGQEIARRPECRAPVWSHYATLDTKLAFVRVGTLDDPSRRPPDVHIFTSTKQPWVQIPAGAESSAEVYSAGDRVWVFGPERMARREAMTEEAKRESC